MEKDDASTVRHLYRLEVTLHRSRGFLPSADPASGYDVIIDAEASSFLPHQVRRMAGALVEVGRGKLSRDAFAALLDGPPASAGPVAPARGLCLMSITYKSSLFRDGLAPSPAVC
jgi:tRNA pseudouridine(38-40) synthase